ncbi:MAG: EamA family transporter [Proteobacteria bacterium]|nr:EamA family transporter [Pseudomonadota bacterium]
MSSYRQPVKSEKNRRFTRLLQIAISAEADAILPAMTGLSLVLVLVSALAHSSWNFLLKRSQDQEVFLWCLLAATAVLLAPLGVFLFWKFPFGGQGWLLVAATVALHALYFVLLGRSYASADLSLVYPIARGTGPVLVPILAVVILGETIALPALLGIAAVVGGIYTVSLWGNFRALAGHPLALLRNPGTRYAVLTGLTITCYAIVDKVGVSRVQPFLYMYLMTLGSVLLISPYVLAVKGRGAIRREWRFNAGAVVVAGLLTFLAYGLVLTAFSLSRVSYVAPAREVGIVIAVLLGTVFLKEPFGRGRLLGSGIIVTGLVLIALSP